MSDTHRTIVDLEARIDAMAEAAERCRKMVAAGKIAAMLGIAVFVLAMAGLLRLGLEAVLVAIGAALGGIVLSGSSKRTRDELLARIGADEYERAMLIAGLDLHEAALRADGPP